MTIDLNLLSEYKSLKSFEIEDLPDLIILSGINGSGKSQLLESLRLGDACIVINNIRIATNDIKLFNSNTLLVKNNSPADWNVLINSERALEKQYKLWLENNKSKQLNQHFNELQRTLLEKIATNCNKDTNDLKIQDIYDYHPIDNKKTEIFAHNFEEIFKRYKIKLDDNAYNEFLISKGEININFLSEKDFIEKEGPAPWDVMNEIMENAQLNYYINSPSRNKDIPYELIFINKLNKAEVKSKDLSGGEKIIMSLSLALYDSKYDKDFPKVLLLDEPDAPLHPSMIKQFLNVIQKVFIEKHNVKVIITTHSPTTIALAPEKSLYYIDNEHTGIKKISQSNAVAKLMNGIQSIRLDLNNNRQIFVESHYDTNWYNDCFKIVGNHLNQEIGLYFISTGGGYSQVEEIVSKLVDGGNNTIRGLVDWDNGNNDSTDHIFILAEGERKEIENVILDPLIIGALLLRERIHIYDKFPIKSFSNIKEITEKDAQIIVDLIIDECIIKPTQFEISEKSELINCEYLGGFNIKIPKWYLEHNGHSLADGLLNIFPKLIDLIKHKSSTDNGKNLVTAAIQRVFYDHDQLIPMSLINTFKELQE